MSDTNDTTDVDPAEGYRPRFGLRQPAGAATFRGEEEVTYGGPDAIPDYPDARGTGSSGDYAELLRGGVHDVVAYIDEHPDEADAVIAAERAGRNRKGIVEA